MKRKIFRYISLVLCLLIAAATLAGCAGTDEKIKVSLCEVTRSVFYAPQYAALAKGFFEEEGVEVELTTAQGADQVMASVLSGSIDIGFAGPEAAIYVYNEGKEDYTQVFAQLTKRDGAFLLAREPIEDFDWEMLAGKKLLPGRKGGVPYMTLEYVVKSKGLTPGVDVEFDDGVQFALLAGSFTGGNGDFVALFEPTATALVKEGVGYIVASIGEESGEIPYTAYFAHKSFIESNNETIQKFVNAVYKGQQWVMSASAREVAEAIVPYFPETDLDILETVVQRYKDIDAWNETPILEHEAFDRLQDVIIEAGELTGKAPYGDIVNNTFAEKAVGK